MEIFWNTIAQYNEGTWWAQFIITLAGIALTLLLYRKPTLWVKRSMKIYMAFLNGWISVVYYMIKSADLSSKSIALFGCGDSDSYGDTFCDGIGVLYEDLKDSGCTFLGNKVNTSRLLFLLLHCHC